MFQTITPANAENFVEETVIDDRVLTVARSFMGRWSYGVANRVGLVLAGGPAKSQADARAKAKRRSVEV